MRAESLSIRNSINGDLVGSAPFLVIPSEVENGAARDPRHGRKGRRLSEWDGERIKSLDVSESRLL